MIAGRESTCKHTRPLTIIDWRALNINMHYVHGSDIAEQLVNEVTLLASSTEWLLLSEQDTIKSYYLPNDNNILTTMIESIIPAPAEYVHSVINLTSPVAWTATCTKSETIETYDHMNTIVHLRSVSMFFGGHALETLFFRTVYVELNKKLFVQAYRSIENDQFKFEEGSIVLSFLPSAWILDVPGDIDPQHCRLRLITQTDPANTVGGVIPGFTSLTALLRNPGAGFGDAYMYLKKYIEEHLFLAHQDPLVKIGSSMETEWADTYCSMNEACGWTAHVKKFGMSVYSKLDVVGNSIIGVKGSYHCPQPLSEVFESFSIENVCHWEPFLEAASIIQKVEETLNLIKVKVRSPISQTLMEHCLLSVVRKVIGGLGVIMFRSAAHESVPVHETYLLPSGITLQPSEYGGCIVSFMLQGFFSKIDPVLYAPVLGARVAMSITSHLKFVASHYASATTRHYKSVPGWLVEQIVIRKEEETNYVQRLQPLCKIILDELSTNLRLNYPHTAIEIGGKRKRVSKTPQSITTINTDHIAAKRKGQFVRPFIFLVSNNKDPRSKYLKRVSMACSHSFFDFLGPDILTDILQHLNVIDVINFSQVCKSFHFFTTGNRAVWKDLFWKRYGRVYGSCLLCHGGLGNSGERMIDRGDHGSLSSCDSFDDWRESLVGKMREERGWRIGRLDFKQLRGHKDTIKYTCAYELDHNNSFLCTSDSSVIKVWSLESNTCATTITPVGPVIGIQSISGGTFVVGCKGGAITFYNWGDWECTQDNTIPDTTLDGFLCMDASTAVWAGPQVHVFDNNTGQRVRTYSDHQSTINCMLASKNEYLLYSASSDGKVVVRDTRTDPGVAPHLTFDAHTGPVNCLKWAKRDCTFVTASDDGTIKYWDPVTSAKPVTTLSGHTGPVTCIDSFDRYKLVTGSKDKTVRVWSALQETGEELRAFDGFSGEVSSVSYFHNEIYTGSCNGELRRWSVTEL